MNRVKYIFFVFLLSFASVSPPVEAVAKGRSEAPRKYKTITHKVRRGDTYEGIAKKYGVRVEQLKNWNRGVDPKRLQIGQRLKIAVINPKWRAHKKRGSKKKIAKRQKTKTQTSLPPKKLAHDSDAGSRSDTSAPRAAAVQTASLDIEPGFTSPSKRSHRTERVRVPDEHVVEGKKLPVVTSRADIGEVKRAVYIMQPDDNLGTVGLEFRLDPEEIAHWNDLETIVPDVGTAIVLKFDAKPRKQTKPLPVIHRVRRGDTYEKIAKKYGVSVKKLKRWNRGINPRRLRIGQSIRMHIPGRDGRSVSYGSANRGRLYNGVALETAAGLKVRSVSHSYGTRRVTALLKAAAMDVQARWPDAPSLVVGDLSYRRGGRIKRHKSHQSGRDADISFYYRGNVQLPDFQDMDVVSFDAAKNWHIFKTLIDTGEVEFIFINYPLQRLLYQYARSIGYEETDLEEILQYPRPPSTGVGTIRHARGHDDHWHIRFKCGPLDKNCR